MPDHSLKNKVAVVAGGAKNLGGLISTTLAKGGAKVVVHYNSSATKADADKTVAAIKSLGSDAILLLLPGKQGGGSIPFAGCGPEQVHQIRVNQY